MPEYRPHTRHYYSDIRLLLSALEALCDYALYKSTFTLHYITLHYITRRLLLRLTIKQSRPTTKN